MNPEMTNKETVKIFALICQYILQQAFERMSQKSTTDC